MAHFKFKVFLNLIRALFPKWNFFDRVAYTFELKFKLKTSIDWQIIEFDQNHHLFGLFVNEKHNLSLAQFNVVEHFATDVQAQHFSQTHIVEMSSYKLLKSLLANKLYDLGFRAEELQFKITATSPQQTLDLYISPLIKLNIPSRRQSLGGQL